ncbi:hypothetical protein Tco_1186612, partial [Tanacetum coccineum]
ESVHNFVNVDDGTRKDSLPHLEPFVNLSERPITAAKEQDLPTGGPLPQTRETLTGRNVEEGKSSRSTTVYVPDWTDMLERFENLQDDYNRLVNAHAECLDIVQKLVTAHQDLEHNARLYTDAINHYKEIMAILRKAESFDAYSDKKLYLIYDKLFEKEYPYVEKISSGYRHSVSDLLKVHPDPAPSEGTSAPTISKALGGSSLPPN